MSIAEVMNRQLICQRLGHSWYPATGLRRNAAMLVAAVLAPGHQQTPCWLESDHNATWIIILVSIHHDLSGLCHWHFGHPCLPMPIQEPRRTWWCHETESFPHYLPFVRGIHRSPVNSPHKGQWRGVSMFLLICTWINGWVNNYDVIVVDLGKSIIICSQQSIAL